MKNLKNAFAWIWRSKFRFLLTLATLVISTFLIFPYDDLIDLVSTQISTATRSSVFVQMEKLRLSLFPQPGVQMKKVFLQTLATPGLTAEEITITPSISALISQKPLGRVNAKGIFKGEVDLRLSSGGKSDKGAELTRLEVQAQKLSLQDLRAAARMPMALKGKLDLETSGDIDLVFQEQPNLTLSLKIQQFEMPASTIASEMGDMPLPELKLSGVEIKGKLSEGRLLIESGKFGAPGEDLSGTIKGSIGMNLRNTGAGVAPEFGAYSLEVDLLPSSGFKQRASLYLSFLSGQQQGDRYRFKVSASSFQAPPNMTPLR